MSGWTDFLLRAVPIFLGGGAVQLIIHMLKRRAENRATNAVAQRSEAEAGQFVVQSAKEALELSDLVRDRAVKYAEAKEAEAKAEAAALRAELGAVMVRVRDLEDKLAGVLPLREEVAILRAENAQLRTEVEICRRTHPAGEVR